MRRGFEWERRARRMPPERGKMMGSVRGGRVVEVQGKVAKIEFFAVGNHAGNGHLSADKVTKCSDKVFVLKKTTTRNDTV